MKVKNYFIILIVLFILLFYNIFAYKFANNRIYEQTKYAITSYFNNTSDIKDFKYEYIKATLNEDATVNVFIKYNNHYYRFIFENNGGFKLVSVNINIPAYIK